MIAVVNEFVEYKRSVMRPRERASRSTVPIQSDQTAYGKRIQHGPGFPPTAAKLKHGCCESSEGRCELRWRERRAFASGLRLSSTDDNTCDGSTKIIK